MIIYGPDCETTGLTPFENELISIQYADEKGGLTFYPRWKFDSEQELLVAFLTDWQGIKRKRDAGGALFVGFNHLKFDVPFILIKCLTVDGILEELNWTEEHCWRQLYRWPMYLDLSHLFGSDFIPMEAIRRELLGTEGALSSKQIPVYYKSERYDLIERYVRDEMETMRRIYEEVRQTPLYDELMRFRRSAGYNRELV